jgi:peptide/nickel transport system substrate-binding protein
MKRAGFPFDPATGKGGYPKPIPYYAYDQGLHVYLAQVEQQQLAKIGIRTELHVVSYAAYLALRGKRRQIPFGPGFWQQDYPEAGSFLEPLFHSRSINDDESNNWSFYKNTRFDELVDRARRELDSERRMKIYREAQEIVIDEAPWAFTHFYRYYTHWQPYVRDFRPHPLWNYDHRRTWVDRAQGASASNVIFSREAFAALLGDRPRPRGGDPR